MPARLPDPVRSLVIQQWLEGKARNNIASENGLSSGAVTNVVNEWRHRLGFALGDELRNLAVTFRKVGITADQCALGFRVASLLHKLGVNEERLEPFILDVYNRCIDLGLSPGYIASHIQDLLEFSRTEVPLPKISSYIKEKADEKKRLEEEIRKLKTEKETLVMERRSAESNLDMTLQQQSMTNSELEWYRQLKAEFRKHSIPVDDISKFTKMVGNIREYGYDVGKVIEEFSDLEFLRSNLDLLRRTIQSLEKKNDELGNQRSTLEILVNMHNQTLYKYHQLEAMGFGLKQLSYLWDTVREISVANKVPAEDAVNKFLLDLEREYDRKLGYESKVVNLQREIEKLNQEESVLRSQLLLLPLVGPKLVKLTQSGVSEQDIVNIAAVFEKYLSGIDTQSFISELDKYGNLKLVLKKLMTDSDRLRQEVESLQTQKRDLYEGNQRILLNLVQTRHTFDFMLGSVSLLINQIVGLVSVFSYFKYLMKSQSKGTEITEPVHDEFVSLTKASKGQGPVSVVAIKKELRRAIEVVLGKLDKNDSLSKTLSNTLLALTSE